MPDLDLLTACFKESNFKMDIHNFEDRLIAQKIVYLLQLKGVPLSYPFHIYVRGPYSPLLTKDLYNGERKISTFQTDVKLSDNTVQSINQLKDLFGTSANLLEIGATYSFFNIEIGYDHVNSLNELKRIKPFFSGPQLSLGISKVKEFLFEPSDQEVANMKNEFSAWQDAAFK